ncbi:MAG: hypothetical protein AUJ92_20965 [Armatimonadetes bacterium CG2_30_59_28]|nr:MAG: hypothetical protein AUJ92_20965 [Armatimonadetes bacterium CG2_30_59_28]PIU64447.1 MAG: hypothetical protein COS85_12510 [Armatimonadetes bacterium CG07_land_8_20_14_0_80_59_28]PIX40364.1 MAG: hypothetical protein COZ56_14910 [Armatimonadetes bacterium CG_4_8_14_3_um_filter_58_9]PIY40713.1 MAG: hypothetical protein COZ05_16965 [Armatimonadetes bacterium CG_4_10_14_3_um_filter_59_10]
MLPFDQALLELGVLLLQLPNALFQLLLAVSAHYCIEVYGCYFYNSCLRYHKSNCIVTEKNTLCKYPGVLFTRNEYSFTNDAKLRMRIAPKALKRFKSKVGTMTRRTCGRKLERVISDSLSPLGPGTHSYARWCGRKSP